MIRPGSGNFLNALKRPSGEPFSPSRSVSDNTELFCNANSRDITLEFEVPNDLSEKQRTGVLPERITLTIARDTNTFGAEIRANGETLRIDKDTTVRPQDPTHIMVGGSLVDLGDYYRIFEALSHTFYIGAFRNAINVGGSDNYYDINIGNQFIRLWDSLKSGGSIKQSTAALKLTQDIMRIFKFHSLEINATSDNRTLQVIVNGRSYKLEELGSGLAQFIIILANIGAKQPSWVLVDEPESNLHASLQIDFLATLASYASEGVVFATHNIGLARAVGERIYSFRLDSQGLSEVRDLETVCSLSEFLGELSFSAYRELGFDKVLLVEGPKDVKTVQQLLRKYNKEHEVVLLPLCGSSLINATSESELQEMKRITENVSALIDSERETAGATLSRERQAFLDICKNAGISCHVLERRAIENYLSERALKIAKGDQYRALEPYQKLGDISPTWGKQENWRVAREMTVDELDGTDLGGFLNNL